jgi:heat shock protein HslJ
MRHALHLLTLTLALSLTVACGTTSDSSSQPATGGAPTIDELRSATFHGLADIDHPVTLASGYWEDEPNRLSVTFPYDFHVLGDLDGSAPDEAVVTLAVSTGGSGTFNYLAIVGRRDGAITNIATAPLGDRVQLRDLRIDNGAIVADVLQAGPDDAMCCPGELVTRSWKLEDSTLTELASGEPARLSTAALGDGTWVLRAWTFNEAAPAAPEVTLQLSEGRLVGSSGCNTYNAAIAPGDTPGALTIGPIAGTRMMCPDAEMSVEDRFIKQLEQVMSFGFMLGQLSLTYRTDDGGGVMLFERR